MTFYVDVASWYDGTVPLFRSASDEAHEEKHRPTPKALYTVLYGMDMLRFHPERVHGVCRSPASV